MHLYKYLYGSIRSNCFNLSRRGPLYTMGFNALFHNVKNCGILLERMTNIRTSISTKHQLKKMALPYLFYLMFLCIYLCIYTFKNCRFNRFYRWYHRSFLCYLLVWRAVIHCAVRQKHAAVRRDAWQTETLAHHHI